MPDTFQDATHFNAALGRANLLRHEAQKQRDFAKTTNIRGAVKVVKWMAVQLDAEADSIIKAMKEQGDGRAA